MVAQLTIPPKTFTRIAFTFGSAWLKKVEDMILKNKKKQDYTGSQNGEGLKNLLFLDGTAHIQEIGRRSSIQLNDVHGRHGQSSTVD